MSVGWCCDNSVQVTRLPRVEHAMLVPPQREEHRCRWLSGEKVRHDSDLSSTTSRRVTAPGRPPTGPANKPSNSPPSSFRNSAHGVVVVAAIDGDSVTFGTVGAIDIEVTAGSQSGVFARATLARCGRVGRLVGPASADRITHLVRDRGCRSRGLMRAGGGGRARVGVVFSAVAGRSPSSSKACGPCASPNRVSW